MSNIAKLFNLKDDFSMKDLYDAYKRKIIEIENNSLSDIDKYLLKIVYRKYYNRAQNDELFNRKLMIDYNGVNTMYHSHSFKSSTNKDGVETVYETNEEIKDGKKNKTINAFKRYPDGKVIPINIKENKHKTLKNH